MPHKDPKTQKMQETVIVYPGCLLPDPMLSLLGYGAFQWIIELKQWEQGLKILLRSINVIGQSYFWYCEGGGQKKKKHCTHSDDLALYSISTPFMYIELPESWK